VHGGFDPWLQPLLGPLDRLHLQLLAKLVSLL
jgi:hypothetical protein